MRHNFLHNEMRVPKASIVLLLSCAFALGSCTKKESNPVVTQPDTTKKTDTVAVGVYSTIPNDTSTFHNGVQIGYVTDPLIQSASGLSASRAYPNMFWTHDDGGLNNYIFLLDTTGTRKAYFLVAGGGNTDWTDMAIGPGPAAGVNYLYLADIGDSKANRANVSVQRFPEPHSALDTSGALGQTDKVEYIYFKYPNGPTDAETILLDPATKDIYIIDKGTPANVFVAHYPQPVDSTFTITKIATIPLVSLRGGSMSSDGQEILVRNLTNIYYWKRQPGESILNTLLRIPMNEPYLPEAHGEAICWSISGNAYYTTSKLSLNVIPDFTVYRRK